MAEGLELPFDASAFNGDGFDEDELMTLAGLLETEEQSTAPSEPDQIQPVYYTEDSFNTPSSRAVESSAAIFLKGEPISTINIFDDNAIYTRGVPIDPERFRRDVIEAARTDLNVYARLVTAACMHVMLNNEPRHPVSPSFLASIMTTIKKLVYSVGLTEPDDKRVKRDMQSFGRRHGGSWAHAFTCLNKAPAPDRQVSVVSLYNKGGSVNGESIGFGAVQHHHAPTANQSTARLASLIDRMGPLVEGMELNFKRTRRNMEESEELLDEAKVRSRKLFRNIEGKADALFDKITRRFKLEGGEGLGGGSQEG